MYCQTNIARHFCFNSNIFLQNLYSSFNKMCAVKIRANRGKYFPTDKLHLLRRD